MDINQFNSSLLNAVKKYYKGPFHQKISAAFSVPNWDVDLGKASGSLFKKGAEDIQEPTPQMVEKYGKGEIGNDYIVTLYADHHLGQVIDLLRQEEINFQEVKRHLESLAFLSGIDPQGPKDLFFRKILSEGFLNWSQLFEDAPSRDDSQNPTLEIKDTEDLAFLGILSLLSVFLNGIGKKRGVVSLPRIFKVLPNSNVKAPWLTNQNFFPLQQASKLPDFQNDQFFSLFEMLNNRYIAKAKQNLPSSLSNILSSGSFLWDKQIFGIDPVELEAMSEEQRVRFLLKKKNAIIEQCFDYLSSGMASDPNEDLLSAAFNAYTGGGAKKADVRTKKLRALRLSNQIEGILSEIKSIESLLAHATASRKDAKESIAEFVQGVSENEYNDMDMKALLLKFVDGWKLPPKNLNTRTGQVLQQLGERYRRQTLLQAKYKEQLAEKGNDLKPLKQQLSDIYANVANDYLNDNIENQGMLSQLLEVHAVFSYFVFNKELFPEVAFSNLTKKGLKEKAAARRILSFFRNAKQKKTDAQALKGTIQEFLDGTSKQIFERFRDVQQGKTRALTPGEIKQIVTVSKDISENPQSFEKFQKLENILRAILIEDQAFIKNYSDLENGMPLQKIMQLQTYMNAGLLFVEGKFATSATGITRPVGFKSFSDLIQRAIGTDDIDTRAFRSEAILDQMRNFNYPSAVVASFHQNIQTAYREVPLKQTKDLELTLDPLDLSDFPQLQQKKTLLQDLRGKILDLVPRGEEAYFSEKEKQSTQRVPSDQTFRASDAINVVFPGDSYTKKYLKERYQGRLFTYDQIVNAVRSFASREDETIDLFSSEWSMFKKRIARLPSNFLKFVTARYKYVSSERAYYDQIRLGTLIALYENIYQEYIEQLRNIEQLNITKFAHIGLPAPEWERASVFEGTALYQQYKSQADKVSGNYPKTESIYQQFLPLFLTSYLADVNNLSFGRVYLSEAKLEAIKEVFPEAERVYGELNAFLNSQSRLFIELKDFFKEKESQASFLDTGFLMDLKAFIRNNFQNSLAGIGEFSFISTIATLGLLLYTKSPVFSAIGGLSISYFWKTGVKPFLKEIYNLFIEGGRNLFGYNSAAGINDYILDLFQVAFQTEVSLAQTRRFPEEEGEDNTLFLNGLFLQEELSILRNSRFSLLEFKNRLSLLVPDIEKNANFSVLILNMFFKLNEPGFFAAPSALLRNAEHPLFIPALQEYFTGYQNLIEQEKAAFMASGHTEEECALNIGLESPFKNYLTEKSKAGELVINFPINSSMYQFLGEQYLYIENPVLSPIQPTQINQGLPSFPRNLSAFLEATGKILAKEEQFLGAIRPIVTTIKDIASVSPNQMRNVEETLKANYMIFRYTFDLARKMENYYFTGTINVGDQWLSSTNERGRSLFLSPLYRETFSILMKSAQMASMSNKNRHKIFLDIMREVESRVNTYLQGGALMAPTQARMFQLEESISDLIGNIRREPQVALAILFEKEQNPASETPVFLWRMLKQEFINSSNNGQGTQMIRDSNSSNTIYLANGITDIFFITEQLRGSALTPMALSAIEDAFRSKVNQDVSVALGFIAQREAQRLRALQKVPRSIDIQALQQSSNQNMARHRGQPLMLMPPAPQTTTTTTSQQTPQVAPAPQQVPQQPQPQETPQQSFQNAPQPQQAPYAAGQGSSMIQGQQNIQQQGGMQNTPIGGSEGPIGSAQGSPQQEQQQGQGGSTFMPLLIPYGQSPTPAGASEGPMQQQEQTVTPQVQEQRASEATPQNYVTVTSDGSTGGTTSATTAGSGRDPWARFDELGRQARQQMEEERLNPPPPEYPLPPPKHTYTPPLGMQDYLDYQEEANAAAQQTEIPYGKAAAVGGGLMLGAALLASMMKKDKKEEKGQT